MFKAGIALGFLLFLLPACSVLEGSFTRDPLTGGVDTVSSQLLNISLPAGLQIYPSHSYTAIDANGQKQGLETFRGHINARTAALVLFNNLKAHGWQLRLELQKDDRSIYLYQKDRQYALLTFHKQGMLTILEIWKGDSLPDDSLPKGAETGSQMPDDAIAGEEYGPVDEDTPGKIEQWGNSVEEREL